MMDKSLSRLSASRLQMILIASIIGIVIIIGIGFYFIQSYLYQFSVTVSHANEDASTSVSDIATLERLRTQLQDDKATVQRAQNIVAASKSYEYQDQIIQDLNTYANRAGVAITSFTFDAGESKTPGSASTTAPLSTRAATPIAGIKSTSVSIALAAPTKYGNLMKFVHSIEQNLTKMQLASLSLTKGTGKDDVSINILELEVYVK